MKREPINRRAAFLHNTHTRRESHRKNREFAGGQELVREPGTTTEDGTNRSVSQRLMGSAFMEFANGSRDYDNASGDGAGAWADRNSPSKSSGTKP